MTEFNITVNFTPRTNFKRIWKLNKSSNLKGKDSIMLPSGVIHVHLLGNYLIIEGINEQLKVQF